MDLYPRGVAWILLNTPALSGSLFVSTLASCRTDSYQRTSFKIRILIMLLAHICHQVTLAVTLTIQIIKGFCGSIHNGGGNQHCADKICHETIRGSINHRSSGAGGCHGAFQDGSSGEHDGEIARRFQKVSGIVVTKDSVGCDFNQQWE